jgi:hypothetical protein
VGQDVVERNAKALVKTTGSISKINGSNMKTNIITLGAATLLFAATSSRAGIIAGPITNPANGHDYYLLTPNTWSASEAEAENLGGTLAIIRSAAEQEWVFSKFGDYGGTNRNLWIGLRRQWQGGPFVWADGEHLDFFNWAPGQPDNTGGVENCVEIWANGTWDGHGLWNDWGDANFCYGLVEVQGKSNEKALSEKEKSLIGTWYESGDASRPAWITGTENKLFLITHDHHAARLSLTAEGFIYNSDRLHGEIVKDKILWSNGTWWSRKPSEFGNGENISTADGAPFHVIPD